MDCIHYSWSLCLGYVEAEMIKNPYISKDKPVVVIGLGVSGRAAVRYLHWCGAKVYVSDSRGPEGILAEEKNLLQECCAGYETGGHTSSFIKQGEFIFLSPGIPRNLKVLHESSTQTIPVLGELALAAPVLQNKSVAITGTNGKTTLTTLVGELLKSSGKKVFVGGNIGTPLLQYLMGDQKADIVVLELSSFQLEFSGEFHADVAVLLNISPDHLDRHGTLEEYINAKAAIFRAQTDNDVAIVGGDDQRCRSLADKFSHLQPLFFGYSENCHAQISKENICLKWQEKEEKYYLENSQLNTHTGRLNSSAAILITRILGGSQQSIQQGLADFQSLPHRMQMVAEINGVTFYNDSKATNTGAVVSGLQQMKNEVILIAGGRDKGDDFKLLQKEVDKKVKKLVLIGEAAGKIAEQLGETVDYCFAKTMKEAVEIAKDAAAPGQAVLLSPACASFDMFDSYGHRGDVFSEEVNRLRAECDKN